MPSLLSRIAALKANPIRRENSKRASETVLGRDASRSSVLQALPNGLHRTVTDEKQKQRKVVGGASLPPPSSPDSDDGVDASQDLLGGDAEVSWIFFLC